MLFSSGSSPTNELAELQKIDSMVNSAHGDISAIKTDNFLLYSVPDPHKNGIKSFIKKSLLKDTLILDSSNQVLEMKVPLKFREYKSRRTEFLSALGNIDDFTVSKPKARDILAAIFKGKILKEIVYGEKVAIAFYKGKRGDNYLEFIYAENPKSGIRRIYRSLEKLLLAKPKMPGIRQR